MLDGTQQENGKGKEKTSVRLEERKKRKERRE